MNEAFPETENEELHRLIHSAYRTEILPGKQQKESLKKMLTAEQHRLMPVWLFPEKALLSMAAIVILLAGGVFIATGGWMVSDAVDVRLIFCGLLVILNGICAPAASILIIRRRKWKQS